MWLARLPRSLVLTILVAGGSAALSAETPQGPAPSPTPTAPQRPSTAQPSPPAQAPPPGPEAMTVSETVVVSASKTEQQLVDAPATMTVIGPRALEVAPSGNYAELLRNVPGLNITQISARDVNVTSRGATGSLATSQLAVLDGRSLYQDFFGFVMWDFMPADLDQIKRIEVIRGPASAVWGANALNGVINILTKTPREAPGSTLTFGLGNLNREVNKNGGKSGSLFYVRGSHAAVLNDRWSYRLSAGTYVSDAFARPNGNIPNGTNTPYPAYANSGTSQPKFDARFDYDLPDGRSKLQFSGGVAGTDGVMHTGLGPFDIGAGTKMGYWKAEYTKNALKVQAFMNTLDGAAQNLVSVGIDGKPIPFDFNTKTFDLEVGNTAVVAQRHVLTYGGNLRANRFHLTIAPGETSRTEGGAYLQDEVMLTDHYRVVAGARVDKFSSIESAVFSPRVAFVYKPDESQSVRVSYNRAFRAPSMVNNNLQTTLATPLPLNVLSPAFGSAVYLVPTEAVGNPGLTEEHIDAVELAYTGNLKDRATISAAVYYNAFADEIFFTQTAAWLTPPPGFPGVPSPFPAATLWGGLLANGIRFPQSYTYKNLGTVKDKGLELGIDGRLFSGVSGYANYAFQADPRPAFPGLTAAQALGEINLPAKHLVNVGISRNTAREFWTLSVSHSSKAFWQDVLDDRFHGFTKAYTAVNATVGMKFQAGRYSAALKLVNLGNSQVQQHVFGDVAKRQVIGELKLSLK